MTPSMKLKKELLATQISYKRNELNEQSLYVELHNFFLRLKQKVLKSLDKYWNDDFLYQGQVDFILSPIFESQRTYYNILKKHVNKEYNTGYRTGKRYVKYAQKQEKAEKAETNIPLTALVKTSDDYFGTLQYSKEKLLNQSFTASENTMNRVDKDINQILSDGYREGWGQDEVAGKITRRFDQLSDWEAKRIARTEIHNAHNMGIMESYDELGVQYTQWGAAHDTRVRDSHADLDGEIIRIGDTYSNGLHYPGDTEGELREWINCRCVNMPFVMPDGYIAPPNMVRFREEDLIQTLDYWNQDELIQQATQEVNTLNGFAIDDLPLDTKYMNREFAVVPDELAQDYRISSKGMDTIRQFQKKSHLSEREMGFAFSENNGRIKTGLAKGDKDSVAIRTPGKCSTIHNHVGEGFNIPSGEDFSAYLKTGNERLAFICSNNETWVIQHTNKKGLSKKYIKSISNKIDELAAKKSEKFKQQYRQELHEIEEKYKDNPSLKKKKLEELKKRVNTTLLEKYNTELGDEILEYTSKVNGLKVRRYTNIKTNKKTIPDLPKLKTEKNNTGLIKRAKLIDKNNIDDYDKYALTESEKEIYKQLKNKQKLKFRDRRKLKELEDRKEFNDLRNKILREGGDPTDVFALDGAEGVRYENLYKQFKDWQPLEQIQIKQVQIKKEGIFKNKEAFKVSDEENKIYEQLRHNKSSLSDDEVKYFFDLQDKKTLERLHKQLVEEGLDLSNSEEYIKLYSKHINDWNLPELSTSLKFTTSRARYFNKEYYDIATEFKLSKKESEELYILEKKQLIGKITSQETKRMKFLQSQVKFAGLNSMKINNGGLNYDNYNNFKKLYKQLKTELKLDKSVLESHLSHYKSDIPLSENPKNFKKFKGTTDDGLLPNGEKIEDYFTKDAREMTIREQEVAQRWLGPDYKAFTNFEVDCNRDVKKFEKWIYDMAKAYEKDNTLIYYKYYYKKLCKKGKILKSEAKDLAESIAHDVHVLDDILNNQTKKSMTLWRVQEEHYLSSTVVGDVMEFPNFRSTAISKEGALWFSGTNSKHMSYIVEIEAPAGTKGAYLAPIKEGTWHAPPEVSDTHPLNNQNYAREMEFLLKKCKVELVKFGGKPVKGANGEDLTPIKLRVVGYK